MKKILRNESKGITLIALVVTIVVLLILAGITITFVLGKGGILDMAKQAAKRTNDAKEQELKDFADFQNQVENWINGGTSSGGTVGSGTEPTPEGTTPTPEQITTKTLAEAKAQKDPFEETTKVTDGKDTMTVPAGFKITEGESIDEGIVVQDRESNEFVWVPVAKINDMVMCQTHGAYDETSNREGGTITYEGGKFKCDKCGDSVEPTLAGKLYATSTRNNFGTLNTTYNANSGLREPDVVTNYDTDDDLPSYLQTGLTQAAFKEQLQNEFYNMAKSVAENGGFYIGRYETSGLKDGETPIVQKGKDPTVSTDWYTMYKNSKEIAKGALKPEEKAEKSSSVTSSMIWGCQWDAVMNWMKNVTNSNKDGKYYITDSTGMGYYDQFDKTTTGSKEAYAVKNIYDMAGNVWEWTLEACYTYDRVYRGGNYYGPGSNSPASYRNNDDDPIYSYSYIGSRVELYVNL